MGLLFLHSYIVNRPEGRAHHVHSFFDSNGSCWDRLEQEKFSYSLLTFLAGYQERKSQTELFLLHTHLFNKHLLASRHKQCRDCFCRFKPSPSSLPFRSSEHHLHWKGYVKTNTATFQMQDSITLSWTQATTCSQVRG